MLLPYDPHERLGEDRPLFTIGGNPKRPAIHIGDSEVVPDRIDAILVAPGEKVGTQGTLVWHQAKDLDVGPVPEEVVFGPWDYDHGTPRTSAVEFHGLITTPANIEPKRFESIVRSIQASEVSHLIPRIHTTVKRFQKFSDLDTFLQAHKLSPETHPEVGFLYEAAQRADKDGHFEKFIDLWTQYGIEWALSLVDTHGAHLETGEFGETERTIIERATSGDQYPTGLDALYEENLRAREIVREYTRQFDELGVGVHYTNELLSTRRFQEFHPILEQTLHVIEDLQTEFPSTEVWNGLEIQFVRFLQNNRAHHPQAQRITSSDREVNELRIDIKHKAYGESPQEIGEKIKHELQTHIEGEPDDDIIYLDRPDTRLPFLETAGQSGWSRFGDVPIAEGIPDLGAAAAENPEVIEFSAQKIFESLKTAPHMDEYVIMESGIWNANGIPEMIARLAELVEAEDDQVLHQKLQRIQIVGIDIAEEGVESFNTRLTQEIEINPLLKKHRGIVCDVLNSGVFGRVQEQYQGKVIFCRSVYVNDAFMSPLYTIRNYKPYRTPYRTRVRKSTLRKMISEPLDYFVKNKKHTLDTLPLSVEDICNALGKATSIEFGECNAFVKHLISKKDLEEPAALLIWKRVINALEKEYRMELADGEDAELASKIGALYPNGQGFFAISKSALNASRNYVSLLHPDCGTCLAYQLSVTQGEVESTARAPVILNITGCKPVTKEAMLLDGFDAEFIDGKKAGLHARAGLVVMKPRKEG